MGENAAEGEEAGLEPGAAAGAGFPLSGDWGTAAETPRGSSFT